MNFLGQVEQLQFAAFTSDRGKCADQLSNPGAVDIGDVSEVEQNFFLPLADQLADSVTQNHAALTQSDAAAHIHDGHAVHLSIAGFHAHCASSSLAFAALRPVCLISVISVPGLALRILTSSMNARIKKIPRPEP